MFGTRAIIKGFLLHPLLAKQQQYQAIRGLHGLEAGGT